MPIQTKGGPSICAKSDKFEMYAIGPVFGEHYGNAGRFKLGAPHPSPVCWKRWSALSELCDCCRRRGSDRMAPAAG